MASAITSSQRFNTPMRIFPATKKNNHLELQRALTASFLARLYKAPPKSRRAAAALAELELMREQIAVLSI